VKKPVDNKEYLDLDFEAFSYSDLSTSQEIARIESLKNSGEGELEFGEDIKYVTLGDSIAAGYNPYLDENDNNEYEATKKTSYDLFFANYYSGTNRERVITGNNYAVPGHEINQVKSDISYNSTIRSSIANANLLFLTVGANDLTNYISGFDDNNNGITNIMTDEKINFVSSFSTLVESCNSSPSLKECKADIAEQSKKLVFFKSNIDIKLTMYDIVKKYLDLIVEIYTINPSIKIIATNYVYPFISWNSDFRNVEVANTKKYGSLTMEQVFYLFFNMLSNQVNKYLPNTKFMDIASLVNKKVEEKELSKKDVVPLAFEIHISPIIHNYIGREILNWYFNQQVTYLIKITEVSRGNKVKQVLSNYTRLHGIQIFVESIGRFLE
jgi:lysophospholipase L1-like esterase